MIIALYVVAILWIVIGTFLIVYTERIMEVLKKLLFMERIRLLAILPVIFGIILIVGAFAYSQIFWLSLILGLLSLIKGVYLVIGPLPQIKALINWWCNTASATIIRLCGLIIFALGMVSISNL